MSKETVVRYCRLWVPFLAAIFAAACTAGETIRFPDPNGAPDASAYRVDENPLCLDPNEVVGLTPEARYTMFRERYNSVANVFGVLPEDIPESNEAHDCQKTINVKFWVLRDTYKNIVTLWALKDPTKEEYAAGVVVGGIVNWGPQINDDVVIPELNSCFIVRGDADKDNWHAWIVSHPKGKKCDVEVDTMDAGRRKEPLRIWRQSAGRSGAKDMVALRLVDSSGGYYIGLQCLDQLCIAGRNEPPIDELTSPQGDHQRLSVLRGGRLRPTSLRGTLDPTPESESAKLPDYREKWVHVADLSFSNGKKKDWQAYATHYDTTVVHLKENGVKLELGYFTEGGWKFRYNEKLVRNAQFIPFGNTHAGTGRWRWSALDEGVWIACPGGCCGDW